MLLRGLRCPFYERGEEEDGEGPLQPCGQALDPSPEILPSLPLTAWRTSKKHHGLTDTGREEPPRGARCLGAEPRLGPALKRRTHHPPTLGREPRWEGLVGDKNVLPKASSCK